MGLHVEKIETMSSLLQHLLKKDPEKTVREKKRLKGNIKGIEEHG